MKFKNKHMVYGFLGLLAMVGTYNAFIINSDSAIHDMKFVKRLDEHLGIIIPGRSIAASMNWHKVVPHKTVVSKPVVAETSNYPTPAPIPETPVEFSPATVQADLNLQLVEVINQKLWKDGAAATQFTGNLETNDGVIESLSASFPNGESMSVSFTEMSGNVFSYDMNGDKHSGMMYQVDEHSYMVTLTSGPMEGTKMRFSSKDNLVAQQETQETLAESNIEVKNFGEENQNILPEETQPSQEVAGSQGFNFGSQTM